MAFIRIHFVWVCSLILLSTLGGKALATPPEISYLGISYCFDVSSFNGSASCSVSSAYIPNFNSLNVFRDFVGQLESRLYSLESAHNASKNKIVSLEQQNAALTARIQVLELLATPNQCLVKVVGQCVNVPSWSNKTFPDSPGMLRANTGTDSVACSQRAKNYYDSCGGGSITVFTIFTNTRAQFKYPN